jgi:hypothetical protein
VVLDEPVFFGPRANRADTAIVSPARQPHALPRILESPGRAPRSTPFGTAPRRSCSPQSRCARAARPREPALTSRIYARHPGSAPRRTVPGTSGDTISPHRVPFGSLSWSYASVGSKVTGSSPLATTSQPETDDGARRNRAPS